MDALTITVIAALICAIILFEVNKRQTSKGTLFLNGNNINTLIDADKKIRAILYSIDNAHIQGVESDWPDMIAEQLMYITDQYISNNVTLSEYNAALDELLNARFAYIA
ncbi:hypothetical protein EOD41_15220 [Mucilaginibacter limnophilus]|uniref:Uncharacterized protein n=1 Tax=Mucilaginibacter limnophilus TaxID=1932778 RepID=A0A437MQ89_9SPHI|nr:hypothetical protein [Mucilaginibacter limnophilus]RVT99791.1 hypothetical protein EOD41_15220 [Mucilaginibacter limnophilus]